MWRNFAPPTVKVFGWLLIQNRIHCKRPGRTSFRMIAATCAEGMVKRLSISYQNALSPVRSGLKWVGGCRITTSPKPTFSGRSDLRPGCRSQLLRLSSSFVARNYRSIGMMWSSKLCPLTCTDWSPPAGKLRDYGNADSHAAGGGARNKM